MRHLRSVSYGILYSRRLILLYSNHLEGRQTVENHHVHIGTRRTHVMTSSISIFSRFLFSRKQVCPRKSRKFAPSKNFPLYGILKIAQPLKSIVMRLSYSLMQKFNMRFFLLFPLLKAQCTLPGVMSWKSVTSKQNSVIYTHVWQILMSS